MKYKTLSQDANSDENIAASENISHDRESKAIERTATRRLMWAILVNIFLTLLLLVSLGFHLYRPATNIDSGFKAQYGRNYDYMTLDHEFDHLWMDPAVETGGMIVMSKDEQGKPTEYGAIAM
ncbi:hypothetical protein BP5796_01602 [Coleophoma crateriformis]|uniref:Uncharacterized protein n=1 Tax=Coleophoma crateriformis TaxID=565419 RepID=A0A3D8T2I2_9HELO|nr:hypothetical protein BP5796_01602 [Coleophoma crateriformis]